MVPKSARILIGVITTFSITTAVIVALCARDLKNAMLIIKDFKEYEDENE